MSAYVIVNLLAFTAGQLMVTLYPIKEAGDFMLAAMLASLAIVPVALTRSAQPAPITIVSFRPWQALPGRAGRAGGELAGRRGQRRLLGSGAAFGRAHRARCRRSGGVHERGDAGRRARRNGRPAACPTARPPPGAAGAADRRGGDRRAALAVRASPAGCWSSSACCSARWRCPAIRSPPRTPMTRRRAATWCRPPPPSCSPMRWAR